MHLEPTNSVDVRERKIIIFSKSHHTPAEIQPVSLQELSSHNMFASHVFEKGQHQFVHAE
jgi:hypothetical protein